MVGVSFDDPTDNAAFRENQEFPYALWSDAKFFLELGLYYGAASSTTQASASRKTVIIDPQGVWQLEYDGVSFLNLYDHSQDVLDDLSAILAAN